MRVWKMVIRLRVAIKLRAKPSNLIKEFNRDMLVFSRFLYYF